MKIPSVVYIFVVYFFKFCRTLRSLRCHGCKMPRSTWQSFFVQSIFFFMRELLFWTVLEMPLGLLFIGGDWTLAGERGRRRIILLWGWRNGRNRGWDWRIFACFFLGGGGMWSFIKCFSLPFGEDFLHWLVLRFLILQVLFKTKIFSLFALPGYSALYSVCIGFTCHSFVYTGDLVRRDIATCGYFVNKLPFSISFIFGLW